MKIGITAIKLMIEKGNEREYAVFLYLKSLFKKGCFYDYTHEAMSAESKLSKSSVRKYIKRFITLGWCRRHGKNLMFKGLKHYRTTGFNKTFILKSKTIKGILKELYYLILKTKQSQFNKLKSVGRAVKMAKSPKRIKRLENLLYKLNKKKEDLPAKNAALTISANGLGEIFNCSRSKANRIINSLNKSKVKKIKGKRQYEIRPNKVVWHFACNKYVIY